MIRWTPIVALLAVLGLIAPALAVYPPAIKDDGKFFSKEGIEKANKKIREIYEKYKKDVIVETVPALTPEQEKLIKEEGATKFYGKLASDRAKALGLNGVLIFLSKKTHYLQIHMDPLTQKKAFTAKDRTALRDKILTQFKADEFDSGLLDGLKSIEAAFEANSRESTKTTPKGDNR
jgi:uncharacterized membrane protein YgcG